MTDVTIVATTWLPPGGEEARLDAFTEAVESWRDNLCLDGGRIHLHVADDGTLQPWSGELRTRMAQIWPHGRTTAQMWPYGSRLSYTTQDRRGVGASLNAGLRAAFEYSPIALYAVDDWKLLALLDLTPWVAFLEDGRYDADMVRFFPHPDLTGTIRFVPSHGWAMQVDPHHFAFGFRPCLWHRRLFDELGWFDEGVSMFEVEERFNWRVAQEARHGPTNVWLALPEQWRPIESMSLAGVVPGPS